MLSKIYAPNVHLFAFYLHSSSNDLSDVDEANRYQVNRDWLWLKCDDIISKILHQNLNILDWLDLDRKPDDRFIDFEEIPVEGKISLYEISSNPYTVIDGQHRIKSLQEFCRKLKKSHNFIVDIDKYTLGITGFARPVKIDDTYGLWLNLRRPEKENNQQTEDVDTYFLRKLNPDNCMMLGGNENFLGQTLIITAYLPANYNPNDLTSIKNLADECLQQFFPNGYQIPQLSRTSTLFGSPIYEYGWLSQISNYRHILVWFFLSSDTDKKFGEYQEQLFDLFLFRNKAIKAFKNSRKFYQDTNNYHQTIKTEIDSLDKYSENEILTEEQLDEFKKKLKKLPKIALDYAELLRELEACQNTISIHASNYNDRLQQIRNIQPDEDISFLEEFSQKNCSYFREQIKFDLGYFNHGSSLLDKTIASIRGRVSIDQSQRDRISEEKQQIRDRNLQVSILAIGSGIGVGGIISSSYGLMNNEKKPPYDPFYIRTVLENTTAKLVPHPLPNRFSLSILYSLGFAIAIGLLIWGGDKIYQNYRNRKSKKSRNEIT
ncbi:hypothetical protein [Calothrix sp. PCC 6303]|uniref:hypothetical protein n=1 Tax=Calothrix sp. PCC 6303 TaxID=1170562 RepID=UPI0002A0189F|nr:hypothetical protein [Calothrix sp. PCC 6303]AFZ04111.1 hypothetical protein Cal6303_5225 [Calothrix sp. PCC 6303]